MTTYIGVIVFVGLAAYDTRKIKAMGAATGAGGGDQVAIFGALALDLDFVNLFLMLLRILGRRREWRAGNRGRKRFPCIRNPKKNGGKAR